MKRRTQDDDQWAWPAPTPPATDVARPHLLARLDEAVHRPLTSITGHAGTGKSVLVAQWCRQRCALPVAWVAVRRHDGVARTVDKVIGALHDLTNTTRAGRRHLPADASSLDAETADLLTDLVVGAPECVIVLDDVNTAGLVGLVAELAVVLESARSSGVHLIAVGRHAPTPAVLPLRMRGKAAHLGAADLELSTSEVAEVVESNAHVTIREATAQMLAHRLDGWTAGAVIVGMTHPRAPDCDVNELLDAAFDDLDAYVTAEILNPLGADMRRFLMLTACVDEVIPALCDAMTGRTDSERLLNDLRLSGVPIRRRASRAGSSRYLEPVREVLAAHAQRDERADRAAALRIAADWFGAHNRPIEAAECWVRLGAWERVFGAESLPPARIVQLRGNRATYLALAGRAAEAVAEARAALVVATESGLLDDRCAADAFYALGEGHRLALRHELADEALARSHALAAIEGPHVLTTAIVASRAHRCVDVGDVRGARDVIERHRSARSQRSPKAYLAMLAAGEARALAAEGMHRSALHALDGAASTAMTASCRVATAVAIGDLAMARDTLSRWPAERTVASSVRHELAHAIAHDDPAGGRSMDRASLRAALAAAADHQLAQPFIELGLPVARELRRVSAETETVAQELVGHILAFVADVSVVAPAPRFTSREAVVLSHITEGMTLAEVADAVHLSVNTVKTHVKSIYRKLGVNTRAEAIRAWQAARQPTASD